MVPVYNVQTEQVYQTNSHLSIKENILRLEIPVYDVQTVQVSDSTGYFSGIKPCSEMYTSEIVNIALCFYIIQHC